MTMLNLAAKLSNDCTVHNKKGKNRIRRIPVQVDGTKTTKHDPNVQTYGIFQSYPPGIFNQLVCTCGNVQTSEISMIISYASAYLPIFV